jgi:hypothetical protein
VDAPPSRTQVRTWLHQLATGSISREEASALAHPWVVDRDREIDDLVISRALDLLLGADMPTTDRPYLHGPEDFQDWLLEYDKRSSESH